jgi:predicted dehydrogenase
MAPDWMNAQKLAKLVRERDAIAAVAQNYRYNAMERTLARAIQIRLHLRTSATSTT